MLRQLLGGRASSLEPKIFCIGLNKTGTTSLHRYFAERGLDSVHNHHWPAYSHISEGRSHFLQHQCYSDGERPNFQRLDDWFPDALFVLNLRDERAWLRSRVKHVLRWGMPTGLQEVYRTKGYHLMAQDFFADPERAIEKWIADVRINTACARAYFEGSPRFMEVRVTEDREWDKRLDDFLHAHAVRSSRSPKTETPHANSRQESDVPASEELQRYLDLVDVVRGRIAA